MTRPSVIRWSVLAASLFFPGSRPAQVPVGALERMVDSLVTDIIDHGPSAGFAVALQVGDNVVFSRGYGMADLELGVSVTENSVFRIGSITKQLTAAAVMQLVERGLIDLDAEMSRYLPDYDTQGHRVTIRHLLTHTSGIRSYTDIDEGLFSPDFRLDLSDEELRDIFEHEPFDFEPGAEWRYNNSGYYLLGMIVEAVTGTPYREYVEQRLFGPLGMESSYYCDEKRLIPDRAEGYEGADGELVNDDPLSMNVPGAAGGLCSIVGDLLRWQAALAGGDVVSEASFHEMTTPMLLNDGSETNYGFGIRIGEVEGHQNLVHCGGINGFVTMLSYFPDDGVTVVVLSNTPARDVGMVAEQIAEWAIGF